MEKLTGNKNVDLLILEKYLHDIQDLDNFCENSNDYIKSLCDDQLMWKRKVYNNYQNYIDPLKYKSINITWREYYTWLYKMVNSDIKTFIEAVRNNRMDVVKILLSTRKDEITDLIGNSPDIPLGLNPEDMGYPTQTVFYRFILDKNTSKSKIVTSGNKWWTYYKTQKMTDEDFDEQERMAVEYEKEMKQLKYDKNNIGDVFKFFVDKGFIVKLK